MMHLTTEAPATPTKMMRDAACPWLLTLTMKAGGTGWEKLDKVGPPRVRLKWTVMMAAMQLDGHEAQARRILSDAPVGS